MHGGTMIKFERAMAEQRERFLGMILDQLGSDSQSAFEHMGITKEDFIRLYRSTGEVRSVNQDDQLAGFVWIEHRDRELHIHGIILLCEWRGRGIGTRVLDLLEEEFGGRADCIELGVQTSNESALRFYERVGFAPIDAESPPGFAVLRMAISGS